jgi:hypothetical protein
MLVAVHTDWVGSLVLRARPHPDEAHRGAQPADLHRLAPPSTLSVVAVAQLHTHTHTHTYQPNKKKTRHQSRNAKWKRGGIHRKKKDGRTIDQCTSPDAAIWTVPSKILRPESAPTAEVLPRYISPPKWILGRPGQDACAGE